MAGAFIIRIGFRGTPQLMVHSKSGLHGSDCLEFFRPLQYLTSQLSHRNKWLKFQVATEGHVRPKKETESRLYNSDLAWPEKAFAQRLQSLGDRVELDILLLPTAWVQTGLCIGSANKGQGFRV